MYLKKIFGTFSILAWLLEGLLFIDKILKLFPTKSPLEVIPFTRETERSQIYGNAHGGHLFMEDF